MKNNLSKVENCLRSIARRNKSIKYSLGFSNFIFNDGN